MLARVQSGAALLRLVAAVAAVVWIIAFASSALIYWHTFSGGLVTSTAGSESGFWRLMATLATATQSTWGYALVAALAGLGSLWFENDRARDLLDVLDDEDDL